MDTRILLFIHAHAGPFLDGLARASHALGTRAFCTVLVLAAAFVHGLRRERRAAIAWIGIGVTTAAVIELLKALVLRPRPELWPRLVLQGGSSFPSGHAIATAAFYPLLAWVTTRGRPRLRSAAMALAVALSLFVGLGRLYLGLHWPTDVLAGWMLGAAESLTVIAWLKRPDD